MDNKKWSFVSFDFLTRINESTGLPLFSVHFSLLLLGLGFCLFNLFLFRAFSGVISCLVVSSYFTVVYTWE